MSMVTGLSGQYIQVVRSRNGEIAYGGDQGFFAGAPEGSADARKQKLGCGVTALSDLFLYLANSSPDYLTQENESYVNRILDEDEYKAYYDRIYAFIGGISPRAKSGLSGIRLRTMFNKMARRQNWRLRAGWGLSGRKLYGRMEEMLSRDIPVILSIPIILRKKDRGQGITFFKKEGSRYKAHSVVSAHYVTVTGIMKEDDNVYLIIASWGKKYYVNWNEFDTLIHTHFPGTILGNILYIRNKW